MVVVECSTSDWHVAAQKAITIQEPVGEFSGINCYNNNVTTGGTKCNVLYDNPVHIELKVETGEFVSHFRGYSNANNHFSKIAKGFDSRFLFQ